MSELGEQKFNDTLSGIFDNAIEWYTGPYGFLYKTYKDIKGISDAIYVGSGQAERDAEEARKNEERKKESEEYDAKYGNMSVRVKDSDGNVKTVKASEMKSAVLNARRMGSSTIYYDDETGLFTAIPRTGISFDSKTGDVTVKIPESWNEDEYIKSYANNEFLEQLSSNYKNNKKVKYQDPYDENKQYTTEEYIQKVNKALNDRGRALEARAPAKAALSEMFSENSKLGELIDSVDVDQLVIMSANGLGDSKYVAVPEWLRKSSPAVEKLPSYNNGFVLADELKEGFLNNPNEYDALAGQKISNTFLTWWATTKSYLESDNSTFSSDEANNLDEFARNVAFYEFVRGTKPNIGSEQTAILKGDAWARGWWYGTLSAFEDTLDNIVALTTFGQAGSVRELQLLKDDEKTLIESYMDATGFSKEDVEKRRQEELILTGNSLGTGVGVVSGSVEEALAEMSLMSAFSAYIEQQVTAYSIASGAEKTAESMAEAVAPTSRSDSLEIATEAETIAYNQAHAADWINSAEKTTNLTAKTERFLDLTMSEASKVFYETYGGTAAVLQNLSSSQAATIINTAAKSAKLSAGLNTAMGIMSDFIIFGAISDKETLNKILTNKATNDETKAYLAQVLYATYQAQVLGFGSKALAESKAGEAAKESLEKVKNAASKKVSSATAKVSEPWLRFRDWFLKRKMENAAAKGKTVSNATLQSYEAVKEAELRNVAREYVSTLSDTPISKAAKLAGGAGVIIDPITGETTLYKEGRAASVALENSLTDRNDIDAIYSKLSLSIADPNIEPVMSAQNKEVNDVNSDILKAEMSHGMIEKEDARMNKKWKKEAYSYAYSTHSKAVSDYAFLAYKVQHEQDICLVEKIPFDESPDLQAAQNELAKAGELVPVEIQKMINQQLLPSLQKLTKSLMDRMIYDWKVYPKELVEALRKEGRWGKDGDHYIRLVAKKEPTEGVYESFDGTAKRINNIDVTRAGKLDVEKSTWIGYGPYEMIRESAQAISAKEFKEASIKATGTTCEVVMSGEKTAGARKMKEYRAELNNAIKKAIDSFAQDIEGTAAVGPKKAESVRKYVEEVTTSGGVNSMEIDELRALMKSKGQMTTDDIVDPESLNRLFKGSSASGKKLMFDTLRDTTIPIETPEKDFVIDDEFWDLLHSEQRFDNLEQLQHDMPTEYQGFLEKLDRYNALANPKVTKTSEIQKAGKQFIEDTKALFNDTIFNEKFSYITKAKGDKNAPVKYDIDEETLYADIDDAMDGFFGYVKQVSGKSNLAIGGIAQYQEKQMSEAFFEFHVLNELLNSDSSAIFGDFTKDIAKRIVDSSIPEGETIAKGEPKKLEDKIAGAIKDKFESRFAVSKNILESSGEKIDSSTITELLDKYNTEIIGFKGEPTVIKTTNANGEVQYEKVSPAFAPLYNSRPVYKPLGDWAQRWANAALMKRISTTNLNPRSFTKQAASDPLLAFATVGVLPGTGALIDADLRALFGNRFANDLRANDPYRYENILAIAERDGISFADAVLKNVKAMTNIQLPFTTMSREALKQADANKYGQDVRKKILKTDFDQKINKGLRKVSEKLGKPNDLREEYNRKIAGLKAYSKALKEGYSVAQAEDFRRHAIDNATTNFRQKHTVFNNLRIGTPYLTSGISGAKSFWKMFELDPIGVTARIFNGFILPIIYFMGEICADDDTREKYKNLSFSEKANHIAIAVSGEIILIPVGEELGTIVNPINHTVEQLYGVDKYEFWRVMLNDAVGLLPVDLTGFTDPEMWEDEVKGTPSFLEVMDNGISKMLAQTMPPLVQSGYMAATGRDLYTGNKINTSRITIDEDGNPVIMSYSQSEFAKAIANIVGGDARVIEKVTSGMFGMTALHTLDTITSAVQFVSTGGKEGSLLTGVNKALEDATKPYTAHYYDSTEKQWTYNVNDLYDLKKSIEDSNVYKEYNKEIAKETNQQRRADLINKRNNLLVDYQDRVERLVKWYRNSGGQLDKPKFSKVVSLLTFEDAVRADRQFMQLNTNYHDAYMQAMQTLDSMGVSNPDGPSMLGYIYTDQDGNNQLKMWTPAQIQVLYDAYYDQQGGIHKSRIEAIIDDRTENSLKNQRKAETKAEQKYWDKYNSTGKLSNAEWDAIDDLRKAYNAKVVLALQDYMDEYGADNILSNDEVMNYLVDEVIKVPSSEERVNNRFVSSGGGVLNKQEGFGPYYIKKIFGVVK